MRAALTINIDPSFQLGPVEVAWHGLMTAAALIVGAWLAARYTAERGLDTEQLFSMGGVIVISGILGAKLLFVAQHDFEGLLSSNGYSIYGGLAGGGLAAAVYLRARGWSPRYLDALAAALPLSMAVGRIGDLMIGEHYGPPSDLPWAIVYSHPDAPVPSNEIAYHPGGLYEVVLSLAIFAVLWPLRGRFVLPLTLLWTTLGAYAAGRFAMFFWRDDASTSLAGLNSAQLESLALLIVSVAGLLAAHRTGSGGGSAVGVPGA